MILQRLARDEFAEDGCRRDCRDFRWGEGYDAVQELEHAGGLSVCRGRRRNAAQKWLCIVFQDRKLEDVGRVEYGVGVLLEREDIAVFASSDALPAHDGILRYDAACAVVAYHATEHAVVRCRDVVVLVD